MIDDFLGRGETGGRNGEREPEDRFLLTTELDELNG